MPSSNFPLYELLIEALKKEGYSKIDLQKSPKDILVNPDLYAKNKEKSIALYLRKDSVPRFFIQKVAQTKGSGKSLRIYFVFQKEPRPTLIKEIRLFGMGVLLFKKRSLKELVKSRNFSRAALKKKIKKKKSVKKKREIGLFPSSNQHDSERKKILQIVDELCRSHDVPIFPKLVEKDRSYSQMTSTQLKKTIKKLFKESEILVCVVKENFSIWVNFEVKNSEQYFGKSQRIILVKNVAEKKRGKKQKDLIKWIEKNKIKYLPYIDLRDFEHTIRKEIYREVKRQYAKEKVPCPF